MIAAWPCPRPGGTAEEYALSFDRSRPHRLLVVPALFEEANRMRRLTVEVMRRLDAHGIDSFLPDLPGCNESLAPLSTQTPASWRAAMEAAADHFDASHVLAIRGGTLAAPDRLPGWHYAPVAGASLLRQMLRARIVAAREGGRDERRDALLALGLEQGLELAGYGLSTDFIQQLQTLEPISSDLIATIGQDRIGGSGLWLRAEPGDDPAQADALASLIVGGLSG